MTHFDPAPVGAARSSKGAIVWFTGLSGAGKTTLNQETASRLRDRGLKVESLDGDLVRQNLTKGLGFSKEDRDENIRRIGFVAHLLARNGVIVLVSAISPYRAIRDEIRAKGSTFVEVFVNAPVEVCEQRDVKGLYRKARAGEIRGFTGVDDPYEAPLSPEVECRTDVESVEESVAKVMAALERL
jgi:adenylylsulfate kinase